MKTPLDQRITRVLSHLLYGHFGSDIVIAATNNRSVLGTLNDYSNMFQWTMPKRPNADLMDTALWLADTPVRPTDGFPDKVTRELFGERKPRLRLIRGGTPSP